MIVLFYDFVLINCFHWAYDYSRRVIELIDIYKGVILISHRDSNGLPKSGLMGDGHMK